MSVKLYAAIVLILVSISFVGCSNKEIRYESMAQHDELFEETEYGSINMNFSLLNGDDIRTFQTKPGEEHEFNYTYLITEGIISLQFRDSEDNVLEEISLSAEEYRSGMLKLESEHDGEVNIHEFGSMTTITSKDHEVRIVISGKDAKGKLHIEW